MSGRCCHTSEPRSDFFIVGIPAVWWLELPGIQGLGVVSLVMGVVFLAVGLRRFFTIKAMINEQPD
jgi:hypothetical protein